MSVTPSVRNTLTSVSVRASRPTGGPPSVSLIPIPCGGIARVFKRTFIDHNQRLKARAPAALVHGPKKDAYV